MTSTPTVRRGRAAAGAFVLVFACAAASLAGACSSDSSTPGGGTDAGKSDAAGGDASGGDAAATDAGPTNTTTCTQAEFDANDHTTGTIPSIALPLNDVNPAQYSPRCLKIKKGAQVTWNGTFQNHPLEPAGDDSSNPITLTNSGTTKTFTFNAVGSFGFECMFHPAIMFGAIQVVP